METQYNLPIKVLDKNQEWRIQNTLQGYRVFSDQHGNLDRCQFSREELPYVGEMIIFKTLKKEAVDKAVEVLKGIEGLLLLPVTEGEFQKSNKRSKKKA